MRAREKQWRCWWGSRSWSLYVGGGCCGGHSEYRLTQFRLDIISSSQSPARPPRPLPVSGEPLRDRAVSNYMCLDDVVEAAFIWARQSSSVVRITYSALVFNNFQRATLNLAPCRAHYHLLSSPSGLALNDTLPNIYIYLFAKMATTATTSFTLFSPKMLAFLRKLTCWCPPEVSCWALGDFSSSQQQQQQPASVYLTQAKT